MQPSKDLPVAPSHNTQSSPGDGSFEVAKYSPEHFTAQAIEAIESYQPKRTGDLGQGVLDAASINQPMADNLHEATAELLGPYGELRWIGLNVKSLRDHKINPPIIQLDNTIDNVVSLADYRSALADDHKPKAA